jgi:AraC family transcriptional regulator, regulatory protein of adaptative response / DNA-3-methyladenine glycosylase II
MSENGQTGPIALDRILAVESQSTISFAERAEAAMLIEDETCYRALAARDPRFDGVFFVGITTTRIYCRPICPARTAGRDRCRFFPDAAMAEKAGFRPCLRCRPELAPGHAPVDAVGRIARIAAARIEAGALNDGGSVEKLAHDLGLSDRHVRRAVRREFGVSPVELAQTRRLLLAKQLLTESDLPIVRIAFASGFESVRRFNASFQSHYRLTPSAMRRSPPKAPAGDSLRLTLAYRPPLAWDALLGFLAGRTTAEVERVEGRAYLRTASIGAHRGWLKVEPIGGRDALAVELAMGLVPALPEVLSRLKQLFDLSARPDLIAGHLRGDVRIAGAVERLPGLRVPGAFDGFELATRAILGQRVSVRSATTLAGRLAGRFGESIATPFSGLERLSPSAEQLAEADERELTALGIAAPRAAAIRTIAAAATRRELDFQPGTDPDAAVARLREFPGLGDWTAQYIAMRALRWPDAFPAGDLGLLKAAGVASPRQLRDTAEAWRPWRSYAAMYLWTTGASSPSPSETSHA